MNELVWGLCLHAGITSYRITVDDFNTVFNQMHVLVDLIITSLFMIIR